VTDHDKIDLSCVEHQGPALLTVGLRSGGYVALILLNAGFIMALTLEQAWKSGLHCAEEMNARYRDIVFDELAIVSIDDTQARTLSYEGPRKEAFSESFPKDSANLRATVRSSGQHYDAGDFEFSHAGAGTGFEAFMMLGKGLCLGCANPALCGERQVRLRQDCGPGPGPWGSSARQSHVEEHGVCGNE
jgi:hypothetical protein